MRKDSKIKKDIIKNGGGDQNLNQNYILNLEILLDIREVLINILDELKEVNKNLKK